MTDASPEELGEFLAESLENLDRFDHDLLALEENPDDAEAVASAFRAIHTLKGTCGFLGLVRLEALAHDGETLLARVRDGNLRFGREVADALLALEDAVRGALAHLAQTGGDEDGRDWSELRARLGLLAGGRSTVSAHAIVFSSAPDAGEAPGEDAGSADAGQVAHPVESGPGAEARPPASQPRADVERQRSFSPEGAVRVDVALLDRLMNLVGELVLARNRVLQLARSIGDATLAASTQQLSIISSELQEQVMKTRMQPIDTLFAKLPRVVRDLAHELGREVDLALEGRETELDRTIVEAIRDPLTHLIRNAVDHGIEPPEERRALDKPPRGTLRIHAYHEGGYVLIEVSDDGRGIDLVKVTRRAIERGLINQDEAARLSPREVAELIFLPGFSTADAVSSVSGRGVGMDVVKTNVEAVGGAIDVDSEPGRGTRFRLRIPLTLAIIPALMVEAVGQRFAIPQLALSELVRVELGHDGSAIEAVDRAPVLRRREQLIPLLDLGQLLGLAPSFAERGADAVSVVVLQLGQTSFGLVVDRIVDTQEIVVKPLGQHVSQLPCYAGATILGDGRVALILDVGGLARLGGLGVDRDRERDLASNDGDAAADLQSSLVLSVGGTERVGVPLASIERLEEFSLAAIEHVDGREVVQYRGGVMNLVRLSHLLGLASQPARAEPVSVVVTRDASGGALGVVVDEVLDIALAPRVAPGRTVVVAERLVRVVDLGALVELASEVAGV